MWKVMVADDEEYLLEAMRRLIKWESMDCELAGCAKNGRELIGMAKTLRPDIIITDIKMPGMDGLSVAKYVYENMPGTIVIFLTAYADFEFAAEAIHYDVSDYVVKTAMMEKLPDSIRKAVRKLQKEADAVKAETPETADIMERLETYIDQNYTRRLTLDDIAEAVHANRSYVSRLYKNKTGENLFQTINRKKIEKAKEYLADGMLVYETAEKVGFEDVAYFSRVFKKLEGYAPRDHEKNARHAQ